MCLLRLTLSLLWLISVQHVPLALSSSTHYPSNIPVLPLSLSVRLFSQPGIAELIRVVIKHRCTFITLHFLGAGYQASSMSQNFFFLDNLRGVREFASVCTDRPDGWRFLTLHMPGPFIKEKSKAACSIFSFNAWVVTTLMQNCI